MRRTLILLGAVVFAAIVSVLVLAYSWYVYMPAHFSIMRHELWLCHHAVDREKGVEAVICFPK